MLYCSFLPFFYHCFIHGAVKIIRVQQIDLSCLWDRRAVEKATIIMKRNDCNFDYYLLEVSVI